MLVLDLDHFKDVNDSYGHLLGDELLRLVSRKLKQLCRDVDVLARLGGDEFAMLVTDLHTPEDAARVAEKLLAELSQPFMLAAQYEVTLGVSIGISVYPADGQDSETLIKNADTAMYQAKEKGRNNFQFFKNEMNVRAVER